MTAQDRLLRYAALKTENAALAAIAGLGEHLPAILENEREMAGICRAIAQITDPMERSVLVLRYIQCNTGRPTSWKIVAQQIYGNSSEKSMTAVFRLHKRALKSFRQEIAKE